MHVKLLIKIRHLYLVGDKEFIMPHFIVSNDFHVKNSFFRDKESLKSLGTLEQQLPYNKNDFIYSVLPLEDYPSPLVTQEVFIEQNILTNVVIGEANNFLSALWYIKDNSVSIHHTISGLVEYTNSIYVSTQFNFFTNHDGTFSDSYFTIEELEAAKTILCKWVKLCPNLNMTAHIDDIKKKNLFSDGLHTEGIMDYDYNKINRLERASILLDTARSQHYLPLKISFFIPMFECLFIADAGGEAQQKVCERIAFYLSNSSKERQKIYNDLKDGYTIRSKFFHGDKLPTKYNKEKLLLISKSIDDIARKMFVRIIERDHVIFIHDSSGKNDYETYLSELIFKDDQFPET